MKKRVVIIIESLNIGGAEKALVALLHHFDYTHYNVTLKVIADGGVLFHSLPVTEGLNIRTWISTSGSIYEKVKSKIIYNVLPAKAVGNWLTRGYDIAIAFCEGNATKWVSASSTRCKKIAWVHTDLLHFNWPEKIGVYKSHQEHVEAYCRFDNIVTVSSEAASCLSKGFGVQNVNIIYNILDPNIKQQALASTEPQLFPDGCYHIVSVGRQEQVKGFDILIHAIGLLPEAIKSKTHLYLIGNGSQHRTLQTLSDELDLQNNITFLGCHSNPYKYTARAHLYVCPSRQEGFNIALLEAMYLGKPVVATDCAGPREILGNGKFGVLTECNPSAMAQTLAATLSDGNLLSKLTTLSIARIKDFEPQVQIEKLMHLLSH